MDLLWLVISALAGVAAGAVVPPLVRRLPEPPPEDPTAAEADATTSAAPRPESGPESVPESGPQTGTEPGTEPGPEPRPEPPKVPYAELAERPGLALRCAAAGLLAGLVLGWQLPAPWPLLLWLGLLPVGLALAVVDWHTRLLPRVLVLPATGLALVAVAAVELTAGTPTALVRAVVAALVVRSTFWVLWWFRSAGFGFGDVRLGALLGLVLGQLGWAEVMVGVYAAFLAFGVPGLLLAVVRRDRSVLRTAYPFGPYLLAGAVVGAAWGAPVWAGLAGG